MVGQGPMCSLLADFTGCQSASLSLFPKAGAGAQDLQQCWLEGWQLCDHQRRWALPMAPRADRALQQHAVPCPWGRTFTPYCCQQGHAGVLGFEEGGWYTQLEKLQPLVLAIWECTNIPVFLLSRQAEGRPCEMPAVSPVDWKGLPSFFWWYSKKFLH